MGSFSFTEEAERDLEGIVDHGREQWGAARTDLYIDALEERLHLLADNPGVGSERDDISPGLYSFPHESHMIYYVQNNDQIVVIRVLHGRMDPVNHLSSR